MKIQDILVTGSGVGITALILGRIYSFLFPAGIGSTSVTFSTFPLAGIDIPLRQQILEGLNDDLISRLLSAASGGAIPIQNQFMWLLTPILAGIVIVGLGAIVVPFLRSLKVPTGTKPVGKSIAFLFYGTIAASLIAGFMATSGKIVLPAFGVILAMIGYFGIVSVVYGFISTQIKALPKIAE